MGLLAKLCVEAFMGHPWSIYLQQTHLDDSWLIHLFGNMTIWCRTNQRQQLTLQQYLILLLVHHQSFVKTSCSYIPVSWICFGLHCGILFNSVWSIIVCYATEIGSCLSLFHVVFQALMNGESPPNPILQCLGTKTIASTGQQRIRLVISDGIHIFGSEEPQL